MQVPADRALDEGGEGALGDDLAVIHDDDAIAARLGFFQLVRRQEQRDTAGAQLVEHFVDAFATLRIDAHGRLVEQQRLRFVQHGARDVEPALHATGERLDRLLRAIRQRRPLQRPVDARFERRASQPVEPPERLEIFARRQQRIERDLLRHHAEHLAAIGAAQALAEQLDLAAIERHAPGNRADQRGFAGAVGPQQRQQFTGAQLER